MTGFKFSIKLLGMSAIKTALKALTGKGKFEETYDDLEKIYFQLRSYTAKDQMKPALAAVVQKLRELQEREAEKNQKKLAYLNLIFEGLVMWDSQQYMKLYELEEKINGMNARNSGETIEKARSLLRRILSELKIKFEAEHHLLTLQMRKAQGLGTVNEEASKNEIFRVAGVKRGGPYSSNNQKRISTVLARKKLGLPLNGSANAGLESVIRNQASVYMAGLMPMPPTSTPSGIKGGGDDRFEAEKMADESELFVQDMTTAIIRKDKSKKQEFIKRLNSFEGKIQEHYKLYGIDFGKLLFTLEIIFEEYLKSTNQKNNNADRMALILEKKFPEAAAEANAIREAIRVNAAEANQNGGRKTRRNRKIQRKTRKY